MESKWRNTGMVTMVTVVPERRLLQGAKTPRWTLLVTWTGSQSNGQPRWLFQGHPHPSQAVGVAWSDCCGLEEMSLPP